MARVNHDLEHDSAGGEGQDRPGIAARTRPREEDALSGSLPLMRVGGLRVRLHWILPLYAACELAATVARDGARIEFAALLIGSLMVLVVVHELGRGLWARRLGSSAGDVTMWPLGGLNTVTGPAVTHPIACEAGGLLTSLALIPILGGVALAKGLAARDLYEFNPLIPGRVLQRLTDSPWLMVLWSAYFVNAVVLVLNLLPMFPMDMGRILAARSRESGTVERAARVGMFFALALLVVSIFVSTRLMGVAAFGFLVCLVEARRAQRPPGDEPQPEEVMDQSLQSPKPLTTVKVAPSTSELDRVLEKISREGLPSLTVEERAVLSRETERRRRG